MLSEWKRIKTAHKDRVCKEGGSMRDCPSIERTKFMLHHYANWVKIRTTKQMHQNGVWFYCVFFCLNLCWVFTISVCKQNMKRYDYYYCLYNVKQLKYGYTERRRCKCYDLL